MMGALDLNLALACTRPAFSGSPLRGAVELLLLGVVLAPAISIGQPWSRPARVTELPVRESKTWPGGGHMPTAIGSTEAGRSSLPRNLTETGKGLLPLISRNNLVAYQTVGDLDRAIPLYKAALTAFERVLGTDHPDTLNCRSNLAGAYQTVGDLDRAIPLYKAALTAFERVLGTDHP
ncbi:tetratricopeptide repeat protein, partial [Nonomuraea sp. NPDC050540]|uniref:tetratricopeptide repeat protein n=1 Tax=Nonomuraea sp. NPDC050540 TaxID=3364367 RepID=UPI0037BE0F18